jgi:hypothetical protein
MQCVPPVFVDMHKCTFVVSTDWHSAAKDLTYMVMARKYFSKSFS